MSTCFSFFYKLQVACWVFAQYPVPVGVACERRRFTVVDSLRPKSKATTGNTSAFASLLLKIPLIISQKHTHPIPGTLKIDRDNRNPLPLSLISHHGAREEKPARGMERGAREGGMNFTKISR